MTTTQEAPAQVDKLEARVNRINALLNAKLVSSKSHMTEKKPAQAVQAAAEAALPASVQAVIPTTARAAAQAAAEVVLQSVTQTPTQAAVQIATQAAARAVVTKSVRLAAPVTRAASTVQDHNDQYYVRSYYGIEDHLKQEYPRHYSRPAWDNEQLAKFCTQQLAQHVSKLLNEALNKYPLDIFKYLPKNVSSTLLKARTEGKFKCDDDFLNFLIADQVVCSRYSYDHIHINNAFQLYCATLMIVLDRYSNRRPISFHDLLLQKVSA